ncbi:MAG: GYD domain-containing protein [Proteobacteria bacterium]|nr:GYD domain-containing protein [Pseudomonadota bacterium]
MGTYIALINYTDQGIRNIKDSPDRAEAARKAIQDMGGDMKAVYLTMGTYDLVVIIEAPSDEVVARFVLATGAQGNVRTTTMRAFTQAEFRDIVAGLP